MTKSWVGVLGGMLMTGALCLNVHAAEEVVEEIGERRAPARVQQSSLAPVRSYRKLAITGELPWNGLGGIGPQANWYVTENVALDFAVGLSGTGLKTGFRGRMLFGERAAVPFVGVGFMTGGGSGDQPVKLTTPDNELEYKLKRTNFLQFVGGYDIITRGGFTFMGATGYALCLNRDNIEITEGVPLDADEQVLDLAHRGGLVMSVNLGYAISVK